MLKRMDEREPDGLESERAGTGVAGFDDVLHGGLPRQRMYLLEGSPGAGKTTLALEFLREGVRQGEAGVYVALSETRDELEAIAESHGWSLEGITICTLQEREQAARPDAQYTVFHPSEIELEETTQSFMDVIDEVEPTRVVFDSLSEMRLLARDSLRYRRQILALKSYFGQRGITALLIDLPRSRPEEFQLESLVHGVIRLEQSPPAYGGQRRRLRVDKLRGLRFREGYHDFRIKTGGIEVYPRLSGFKLHDGGNPEVLPSGVDELDELTGGGLDYGTVNLFLGPAGAGKSTLATHYLAAALHRGDRVLAVIFEENDFNWRRRARTLGLDLTQPVIASRLVTVHLDPVEMFAGELSDRIRREVVEQGATTVLIDSLNGYHNAMPEEGFLSLHLHALFSFLNSKRVLTLAVAAQHGLFGQEVSATAEISYLADTVVLLRYFEAFGQVRKALSVVKKRTGYHERSIRELLLTQHGIRVGEQLRAFQGVMSGELVYHGAEAPLLEQAEHKSHEQDLRHGDA